MHDGTANIHTPNGDIPSTQPEVGQWIREHRDKSQFSLADVAIRTGLSRSGISAIETGRIESPRLETASKIIAALGGFSTAGISVRPAVPPDQLRPPSEAMIDRPIDHPLKGRRLGLFFPHRKG